MVDLTKPIVLGSKSPRRKELLSLLVPSFTIFTKDVDESFDEIGDMHQVAIFLAEKKAKAIVYDIKINEILITADSVVILGDEILNKPQDRNEAISMLTKLSGKWHEVQTGVAIANQTKLISFSETTRVLFDDLSTNIIEKYIDECSPYDKAGSYGIQDWIGYVGAKRIEGSYANIMGLPVQKLYRELIQFLDEH